LVFAVIGAIVLVTGVLQSDPPSFSSVFLEKNLPPSFQLRARPADLQRLVSHAMEEEGRSLAEENEKLASLTETVKQEASKTSIKKNSSDKGSWHTSMEASTESTPSI
jgi:hypothetical protein